MLNPVSGISMEHKFSAVKQPNSYFMLLLWALIALPAFSQQDSLNSLVRKFDSYWSQRIPEKIYVHVDQNFFITGETIWFNIYLVDGFFHRPIDLSKVVYLELIDKDKVSVLKTKVAASKGQGTGTLFLPASLPSGSYALVAYTRWMRNFSPDSYFQQTITVVNPFVPLNASSKLLEQPSYDIQFFPEGGNLVAGLPNTVAFRAVGKDGIGIYFRGAILNSKNDTVTRISPLKFGLGRFRFTPEGGQRYTLVFVGQHGEKVITPIPAALESGYALHLKDSADFVEIIVHSKFADGLSKNNWIHLFVQSRQVKVSASAQRLSNGNATFFIDKKTVPEGVNHFTLFDDDLRPVCERLYFKSPLHNLHIDVKSDLENYLTRQKIELNLNCQSSGGLPSNPMMSIAVYRLDSLERDEPLTITNYLWLASELKGTIESPEFYLSGKDQDAEAVDNLMLTHGWSRFKWDDVQSNQRPGLKFAPEYGGHLLTGHVLDRDGNRTPAINTYFSVVGKDAQLSLARSNENGSVTYEIENVFGKHRVVAQTNSESDSTLKVELDNEYAEAPAKILIPEFTLSEKWQKQLIQRNLAMQIQHSFDKKDHYGKVIGIDSLPFYGLPNEGYRLDDFTRFPTMEEVFREYIRGIMVRKKKDRFHFLTLDRATNALFKDNPLVMIDGVPIFNLNKVMAYDPRKVQKIEVVTKQYYLGHLTFDGLVNCITYKGDLEDFNPDFASVLTLEGLQPKREFFSPRYENKSQQESRIPDKRHLLLWSTDLKNDQGKGHLEFYASDIPGTYQIVVEGLSEGGEFGFAMAKFQVKK
jgi:hypothetical protein